jgi:hypothetical protein
LSPTQSRPACQLLERLRQAPAGHTGEVETATGRQIVLALVATLQTISCQIAGLDVQIAQALGCASRRRDLPVVLSQPELGDLRRDAACPPASTIMVAQ